MSSLKTDSLQNSLCSAEESSSLSSDRRWSPISSPLMKLKANKRWTEPQGIAPHRRLRTLPGFTLIYKVVRKLKRGCECLNRGYYYQRFDTSARWKLQASFSKIHGYNHSKKSVTLHLIARQQWEALLSRFTIICWLPIQPQVRFCMRVGFCLVSSAATSVIGCYIFLDNFPSFFKETYQQCWFYSTCHINFGSITAIILLSTALHNHSCTN